MSTHKCVSVYLRFHHLVASGCSDVGSSPSIVVGKVEGMVGHDWSGVCVLGVYAVH